MSNAAEQQQHWYYAEGDKSVGPMPLADLIMILSRLSEPQSVLVWRGGLSDWVQAKELPELAPYVTKPPPQPVSRSTFEQLLAAAQRGDARSQYELAGVYYNGDGVARNPVQGGQWLLNAAEAGYVPAQCDLGVMYQQGVGVDQSRDDALKWYRRAAEQGDALACHNLGSIYAKGFKDKKLGWFKRLRFARLTTNNVEAYKWFSLAAKRGHAPSEKDRSRLKMFMTPDQIALAERMVQDAEQSWR